MIYSIAVVICAAVSSVKGQEDLSFPPGFKFGVASAAYQVEGAWNVSDKSPSVWDKFLNDGHGIVKNGSTGNEACDSYHLWRRDVEMIAEVGAHFYRFSRSWSRLLPNGFTNKISADGKRYYDELINGLVENGIEPVATLYHGDLPQTMQDLGGWANPLTSDWFADYARVVYSLYGDRVKTWLTINEPRVACDQSFNNATEAPGVTSPEVGVYLCYKHLIMAHAKAWRVYDEEFKPLYHGEVSVTNNLLWIDPETPEDEDFAEIARQHINGRFCHPIYSNEGGWPPTFEKQVAEFSKKLGYHHSNLPGFTPEEIEYVKGTFDFFALNYYTSRLIRRCKEGESADDLLINAMLECSPDWATTTSAWYCVNPVAIRRQLAWLKQEYGDLKYFISENGYPTTGGLDDQDRIDFYKEFFKQLLLSIKEDGINVTGYTTWTLMDNFEWNEGYTAKYGLYEVDFQSPNKTRTPRASAKFYANLIRTNAIPQV